MWMEADSPSADGKGRFDITVAAANRTRARQADEPVSCSGNMADRAGSGKHARSTARP
jgi:hypothetical protein